MNPVPVLLQRFIIGRASLIDIRGSLVIVFTRIDEMQFGFAFSPFSPLLGVAVAHRHDEKHRIGDHQQETNNHERFHQTQPDVISKHFEQRGRKFLFAVLRHRATKPAITAACKFFHIRSLHQH